MESKGKNSILVIDDERSNIIKLAHILSPEYTLYASKNGENGVAVAKKNLPDIILLDIIMPEIDGYEVLYLLKNQEETSEIPVIFVTGRANSGDEERGLALGAADYIAKPFNAAIVKLRIRNQIKILNLIEEIRFLSATDPLTGIPNRRTFDERLLLEWNRAKRDRTSLTLFLIDIDNFKPYNDAYGHLQGDAAMQAVTSAIKQALRRATDFVARWGGEEFAVLLPGTNLADALNIAEQIRKTVENRPIPCDDGALTKVTISIGVNAHMPESEGSMHDFVVKADKALYAAKGLGKNKVCS